MQVTWSRAADHDLARIYDFLEEQSLRAARRVLREIFQSVDTLSEMPRAGKVSELELDREYRELVVGHYKLFYVIEDERIVIVRLWDTRQDPAKFFIPRD